MFANYYGEIRGGRSFAGAQDDKEDWLRMARGFPVEPGMTRMRTGMTGGAKGMTERVNIGKDGERPVGKTRGRTVESEKEVRMKGEER